MSNSRVFHNKLALKRSLKFKVDLSSQTQNGVIISRKGDNKEPSCTDAPHAVKDPINLKLNMEAVCNMENIREYPLI